MYLEPDAIQAYLSQMVGVSRRSLLCAVAALSLDPANADFLFRLTATQHLLNDHGVSGDGAKGPDASRLRSWLAASPFASYDDPLDNVLADEAVFYNGSYVVLPAQGYSSQFVFKTLSRGLFLGAPWRQTYADQAERLTAAALTLSNEVARRAHISRWTPGTSRADVRSPVVKEKSRLLEAVQFENEELISLLAASGGGTAALSPLTHAVYEPSGSSDYGNGPLNSTPLLRTPEGLIVALPHHLLFALNHALCKLAADDDPATLVQLAARFHMSVMANVDGSLTAMRWRLLGDASPRPLVAGATSVLYSFDTDKVAHVLVITDPLTAHDGDCSGPWLVEGLGEMIAADAHGVDEHLCSKGWPLDDILHLIVMQSVERPYGLRLDLPVRASPSQCLVLNASDLEIIAGLETDPLLLWKYALAQRSVRESAQVVTFAPLDEFQLYRAHDFSYYFNDGPRPTQLLFSPTGEGGLRQEIRDKYDFHGTVRSDGRTFGEVALLYGDRSAPLYCPWPLVSDQPSVLVEGWPLVVWVEADTEEPGRPPRALDLPLFALVDCVGYWLWQLTTVLAELGVLDSLATRWTRLVVVVGREDDGGDAPLRASATTGRDLCIVRLAVAPSFTSLLATADNSAERQLVDYLVSALLGLVTGSDPDALAIIPTIVDAAAPLGLKKKLTVYQPAGDPRLDDAGLPTVRRVQAWDRSVLLDEVGAALRRRGFTEDPLSAERTHEAANAAVGYFFEQLQRAVSVMSPNGLMERLIAACDSVVVSGTREELELPTRSACFAGSAQVIADLKRRTPAASETAIAARFLVEYVAARPPSGMRPISLSAYDTLLALAAEVVTFGTASDLLMYRIAQIPARMLPSGRIGFARGTDLDRGRDAWLEVQSAREFRRRERGFQRWWANGAPGRSPEADELDAAAAAEFGLTMTQIVDFVMAMVDIGSGQHREPKVMDRIELSNHLARTLHWDRSITDAALQLFELKPRADFLDPPGGAQADVYPWIFNRSHSYLRRPLVVRTTDRGDEVLWGNRHLYSAWVNLLGLCLDGRLRAKTSAMKKLLSRSSNAAGRAFNEAVASEFSASRYTVKQRVTKIGAVRIQRPDGQQISDVDVLVADPVEHRILVIEAKAVALGRTARELANERDALFVSTPGRRSEIDKLVDLMTWIEAHRQAVLAHLHVRSAASSWRVEALMVVETELLTPLITALPVRVLTLEELRAEVSAAGDR
jgi:hypothetical protein